MERINNNRVVITVRFGDSYGDLNLSGLDRNRLLSEFPFLEGAIVLDDLAYAVISIADKLVEHSNVIIILVFDNNNNLIAGEPVSSKEGIQPTINQCLEFDPNEGYWFMVTLISKDDMNL